MAVLHPPRLAMDGLTRILVFARSAIVVPLAFTDLICNRLFGPLPEDMTVNPRDDVREAARKILGVDEAKTEDVLHALLAAEVRRRVAAAGGRVGARGPARRRLAPPPARHP